MRGPLLYTSTDDNLLKKIKKERPSDRGKYERLDKSVDPMSVRFDCNDFSGTTCYFNDNGAEVRRFRKPSKYRPSEVLGKSACVHRPPPSFISVRVVRLAFAFGARSWIGESSL